MTESAEVSLLDSARGPVEGGDAQPDSARSAVDVELRVRATRLERALEWAQGLAPSPYRVATSCCGMAMVQGGDPFEALGAGPPAVSARAADLLIVAGSITRRQAPLLRALYDRMIEPRWVIAWGACASTGGPYANYATIHGLGRIVPVDLFVPGCPPPVTALRDALEWLRRGKTRGMDSGSVSSRTAAEWPILRGDPAEAPRNHPGEEGLSSTARETAEVVAQEGNEDVDRD